MPQSTEHFSGVSCRCYGPLTMVHQLYGACAGGPTAVEFGSPIHWLVGCRYIPRRRVGVVAFASINPIGFLPAEIWILRNLPSQFLFSG